VGDGRFFKGHDFSFGRVGGIHNHLISTCDLPPLVRPPSQLVMHIPVGM